MEAQAMEGGEAGKAAVRELLVRRLHDAGLKRPKGQTEAAAAKSADALVDRLAYMTPDNLATLADAILHHAAQKGAGFGVWPAEVLIISWAEGLQRRPFQLHRIVSSWLASVRGPEADAGGYLVELFRFLRRHCRPPTAYDLTAAREAAREANRQRQIIEGRIERGVVSQPDRDWLEAYLADERMARAFVAMGNGARAAMAQQQERASA